MTVSLICLAVAALCYAVSQLQQHGKLVWSNPVKPRGFWGKDSDKRKYKYNCTHEPAFPLSTTLLVFVTDGYHFMQWLMKIFIALAFVPFVGWWSLGYWAVFTVVFAIGYKFMQK
jgi:hypothetical protein